MFREEWMFSRKDVEEIEQEKSLSEDERIF